MFQFRVTKYDPRHRDGSGRYVRDEWTAFSDVGREYDGTILTLVDYERVESAYLESALAFLDEAGVRTLSARGVENASRSPNAPTESTIVEGAALQAIMRGVLREEFWCRLESRAAFVHFGWDYYMYVGVPTACERACAFARSRSLFVEPFESPYAAATDGEVP